MSDEFDAGIERLFARTPNMPDSDLFAARVEQRLKKGSALRTLALTAAGVVGGAVAVRESLGLNINLSGRETEAARAAEVASEDALYGLFSQWGLADAAQNWMSTGSLGGMQLFWIGAATVIGLAAVAVVRLSQEI
jgi:hypothetical protein